jgi:hypothetical protein
MGVRSTIVTLLLSVTLASASTPGAQGALHPATYANVAPADEYFGRQKMSILEIGNRLRDLTARAGREPASVADIMHVAASTEDALRDWERKYSADPWLAKDVAALVHLYAKLPASIARVKMHATLDWLRTRYAHRRALLDAEVREVANADARSR